METSIQGDGNQGIVEKLSGKWIPHGRFNKIYHVGENKHLSLTPTESDVDSVLTLR